jgi:hypothetical protein
LSIVTKLSKRGVPKTLARVGGKSKIIKKMNKQKLIDWAAKECAAIKKSNHQQVADSHRTRYGLLMEIISQMPDPPIQRIGVTQSNSTYTVTLINVSQ